MWLTGGPDFLKRCSLLAMNDSYKRSKKNMRSITGLRFFLTGGSDFLKRCFLLSMNENLKRTNKNMCSNTDLASLSVQGICYPLQIY
jgi:hypothetical protein